MSSTYEPIATTTLGSAVSSYTFSSIPQTYTDLVLVYEGTGTSTDTHALRMQFNGETGTYYSYTALRGNGSSATSARGSNQTFMFVLTETTQSGMNNALVNIFNYSNTTTFKTCISRGNNALGRVEATVNLYRLTTAITSINMIPETGTIDAGTTFTLYGIKAE
jgi:hypothetical protein